MLSNDIRAATNVRNMDKGRYILEAIMLLQKSGAKAKRLPLWHYALDYFLTTLYLTLYGFGVYALISWLWV